MAVESMIIRNGRIYSSSDAVTSASTELGRFEGEVTLNIVPETNVYYEQGLVGKDPQVTRLTGTMNIAQIHFSQDNYLGVGLGISSAAGSMKTAGKETATVWDIKASAIDVNKANEYLFSGTRSDTEKVIQWWIAAAALPGLPNLVANSQSRTLHDVSLDLYEDSSGYWIQILDQD